MLLNFFLGAIGHSAWQGGSRRHLVFHEKGESHQDLIDLVKCLFVLFLHCHGPR
jgi:hypothetical protein